MPPLVHPAYQERMQGRELPPIVFEQPFDDELDNILYAQFFYQSIPAILMTEDANSMAFFDAWAKHQPPPDKLGLTYMLAGDDGASNTDPYATAKTADNQWVTTGPHVMVVGPAAKSLGLSSTADADPSGPYMLWAGTPYEHAMIPVASAKPAASKADEMKK